jgi:hypothetical protein
VPMFYTFISRKELVHQEHEAPVKPKEPVAESV